MDDRAVFEPVVGGREIRRHADTIRKPRPLHETIGRQNLEIGHPREHRAPRHGGRTPIGGGDLVLELVPCRDVHRVDRRQTIQGAEEILRPRQLWIHQRRIRPIVVADRAVVVDELPQGDAVARIVQDVPRRLRHVRTVERSVIVAPAEFLAERMRTARQPFRIMVGIDQQLAADLDARDLLQIVAHVAMFTPQRLQRRRRSAYEDYQDALISKEDFLRYRADYDAQEQALQAQLDKLRDSVQDEPLSLPWVKELLASGQLAELDRPTVAAAIREIRVYEGNRMEIDYLLPEGCRALLEGR